MGSEFIYRFKLFFLLAVFPVFLNAQQITQDSTLLAKRKESLKLFNRANASLSVGLIFQAVGGGLAIFRVTILMLCSRAY